MPQLEEGQLRGFWWKTFLHYWDCDIVLLSDMDPGNADIELFCKSVHGMWKIISSNYNPWWGGGGVLAQLLPHPPLGVRWK